jgi:hypothetical protein
MNRLAEAMQFRLHQCDSGLELKLRLTKRQAFAIDVDVIAVGALGESGHLDDFGRGGLRHIAGQGVELAAEIEIAGVITGRINIRDVAREEPTAIGSRIQIFREALN